MQWYNIEKIEIEETSEKLVPMRMKMTRRDGSVVTSAGQSVGDAAVVLFSTAGLGRYTPKDLAKMLKKKLDDLLSESWLRELITKLSTSVIM